MSNAYDYKNRLEDNVNLKTLLKNEFPEFEIIEMDKPLRLPLDVTKFMKAQTANSGQVSKLPFNSKLIKDCSLPSNMAEGSINAFGIGINGYMKMELLHHVLKQAFESEIMKDKVAMIIIDDRPNSFNTAMKAKINCSCRDKINVLLVDYALQLIGRKPPKILTIYHSSSIQEIKQWIIGRMANCLSGYFKTAAL